MNNPIKKSRDICLANAMKDAGHFSKAIEVYLELVNQKPANSGSMLVSLAECYLAKGERKAALNCYLEALRHQPENPITLNHIGVFFISEAQYEKAIKIFLIALQIDPKNNVIRLNLASAYREIGDYQLSLGELDLIIATMPDFAEAHVNKGLILMYRREYELAEQQFKLAFNLNKELLVSRSNFLYCSNYNPNISSEDLFSRYKEYNSSDSNRRLSGVNKKRHRKFGSKLRLGYISPDFRNSSAAFFILPILRNHNRNHFKIIGFGNTRTGDHINKEIIKLFDEYFVLDGLPDSRIESLIKGCDIDFLIDLAGHSAGNYLRVLRNKPAKIQASTLGFGYTTGLESIDFFIADSNQLPDQAEKFYSEKLMRITAPIPYTFPPSGGAVKPSPAKSNGFVTFGCLSRSLRLNDFVIGTWARILRLIPTAKLLINCRDFRNSFEQEILQNQFEALGVDKSRLSIGYNSPPWELYDSIDISLDCFPHNSGTTLIEGIFKGVPFITLCGELSMQRIGFSILTRLSLDELVAFDVNQYVDIATRLASNLEKLEFWRSELNSRANEVFSKNCASFVQEVEEKIQNIFSD